VQQACGDDDLRAAGVVQQPGYLKRMLDERRAIALAPLTGVTSPNARADSVGEDG